MDETGTCINYSIEKGRWIILNRSFPIFYLLGLLVAGYLGGLWLFSYMPTEQVNTVIKWMDPRILEEAVPSTLESLLPQIVSILLLLLFATHMLLKYTILLIGTMRAVFWGICSGYLIAQEEAFWSYALWWFPFQLLYCSLLLLIGFLLVPPPTVQQQLSNQKLKAIGFLGFIYLAIIGLELFVLPYIHVL